jgi:hypothetical protein
MIPKRHNPDAINMAHRNHVSKVAFEMLDRVQTEPQELQLFAIAFLYAALCQRLNVDGWEQYMKARKMLNPEPFDRTGNERYYAMLDYAGSEVKVP